MVQVALQTKKLYVIIQNSMSEKGFFSSEALVEQRAKLATSIYNHYDHASDPDRRGPHFTGDIRDVCSEEGIIPAASRALWHQIHTLGDKGMRAYLHTGYNIAGSAMKAAGSMLGYEHPARRNQTEEQPKRTWRRLVFPLATGLAVTGTILTLAGGCGGDNSSQDGHKGKIPPGAYGSVATQEVPFDNQDRNN
ncbi:MAG TPA: hypothetical protein VGT05_05235 [Patescibacteria group bacterium]|nr:hypothetical protein [Patescibacteria group bacterium]